MYIWRQMVTLMKVKIKEVSTYEYDPLLRCEMKRKGKVYINPYLITIDNIKSYGEKKFVLLYQKGKAYYVLLSDIEDIIEIC